MPEFILFLLIIGGCSYIAAALAAEFWRWLSCKRGKHDWRVEWQRPAGSKTYSTLGCRRCPAVSYRDS